MRVPSRAVGFQGTECLWHILDSDYPLPGCFPAELRLGFSGSKGNFDVWLNAGVKRLAWVFFGIEGNTMQDFSCTSRILGITTP